MVNISLGNLLRCLVGDKPNGWDMILAQAEFAYNNSMNRSTGKTPFEIISGTKPKGVFDLRDFVLCEEKRSAEGEVFVEYMSSLHKEVLKLEQGNEYKEILIRGEDIMI